MKQLDTSSISSSAGMPIKSGTLDFLQLAYQEAIAALAQCVIANYNSATPYILYGCVASGSGPFSISAGAIFYNGLVYLVPAATGISLSGSQVIVGGINTTYYTTNADPVTFTDNSTHNVHDIIQITFAAGASGSGLFDFSACVQASYSTGAWNNIGDAGQPTLIDSGNITITTLRFRKNTQGLVEIQGNITVKNFAQGGTMALFNLPAGFQPASSVSYLTGCAAQQNNNYGTTTGAGQVHSLWVDTSSYEVFIRAAEAIDSNGVYLSFYFTFMLP